MSAAVPSGTVPALAPVLIALGLVATAAGLLLLRSFGPGVRVGRLLSVTPRASLAEAIAIAGSGEERYVGVEGRIDAVDEFTDENDRPLVYRRRRIQVRSTGRWRTVEESVESVPFSIDADGSSLAIDPSHLADGLVVLPRESIGRAREVPGRLPPGTPADAAVRLRIDQVSSVEHATVLGCPRRTDTGVALVPGTGRPLVLSTLEREEAMRVLAEGRRGRAIVATGLLVGGPVATAAGLLAALIGGLV
jgi:hypothetical protein